MTIDRALEIFDMFSPTYVSPSDDEINESLTLVVTALRFMKMMQTATTCNTCAVRSSCNYAPAWGEQVRYNCPHYVKEMV